MATPEHPEWVREPITITDADYRAARNGNLGLCLECGAERGGCEPDARRYYCEACEGSAVYGIEELLMMNLLNIVEEA